jgi:hypothetical protein
MMTRASILRWCSTVSLLLFAWVTLGAAPPNVNLFSGLVWRNVGPFRAGRVSAVSGAIGQPGTFYIGLPLGGVWKTTSAGTTWYPIFDDVKESSSGGAVEVAPSDPNVIYVGMGDMVTGNGINEGNGVYKSADAGKTWTHLGLAATKQIPSIVVDPKDPTVVLVAAQGDIRTLNEDRGVYRSTDGGRTWKKTLFVDNRTGIQKIVHAFDHPNVMLATTVRHYNDPAAGRGGAGAPPAAAGRGAGAAGPTGTALYKSTDGGVTWTEITGGGLPDPLSGRTTVFIAANTNAQRMFLIGGFGLYRSDDGGATWKQMDAADRRIANGQGNYTSGVFVDAKNPDVVYTLATSSYVSRDGGNTFTGFKGAPGGDDPQVMWIDPTDGHRMLLGVDQGATISLDGGLAWSSWYNQPTGQVYKISTDNQYPYWIYATQQDSGSIATSSRGNLGAVTNLDWLPHPGYEFGYIVADPLNPKVSYAGGPGSGIIKTTYPSGQWVNVSPNVSPCETLRKTTNQPLVWSPQNPRELMVGFQYVFTTTDGGLHWKKISPDLGYAKGVQMPPAPPLSVACGGSPVPAAAAGPGPAAGAAGAGGGRGGGGAGSIQAISASTLVPGLIWVGTSNGLVKLTKDHGLHWDDVSIPNSARSVTEVDSSHTDPGAAYAAVDTHGQGDLTPHFYRTHDYGKTWTEIVNGLATGQPNGSFARVIRADTKKAGLLFAGTESSMYVSFDDGDNWQSLMLNLPNTSYRDIAIHENDLVVGTYGRSFWILDDYSPLRQITPAIAGEPAHLFKPGDAIRVRRNVNGDTPFPPEVPHAPNPPLGAVIYYYLSAKPSGVITIEIADAAGKVIRHMSSAPMPPSTDPPSAVPDFWKEIPRPMPAEVGTNRVNWNIRYDNPPAASRNIGSTMGAMPGDTPAGPEGPLAMPGVYTVKLTVDGTSYTQTVTVKNDPRSPATAIELAAQHALQVKIYEGSREAWDGVGQVAAMRAVVAELARGTLPAEDAAAVTAFDAKLAGIGGAGGGGRRGGGGAAPGGGAATAPSFQGVNGTFNRQIDTLDFGDMAPTESMHVAYLAGCRELKMAVVNWKAINTQDLVTFNAMLVKDKLKPIAVASPALAVPLCAAPAAGRGAAAGRGRGGT